MQLIEFNKLDKKSVREVLHNCNASEQWGERMSSARPFRSITEILETSIRIWSELGEAEYLQAFDGHPKIGDPGSLKKKYQATHSLAKNEQSGIESASDDVIGELSEKNTEYLERFGFIFIVCATGKSAAEMLGLINQRLPNTREQELQNAAIEQQKITAIRINKLFG